MFPTDPAVSEEFKRYLPVAPQVTSVWSSLYAVMAAAAAVPVVCEPVDQPPTGTPVDIHMLASIKCIHMLGFGAHPFIIAYAMPYVTISEECLTVSSTIEDFVTNINGAPATPDNVTHFNPAYINANSQLPMVAIRDAETEQRPPLLASERKDI